MGNRALIKGIGKGFAVYVHWNGGYDSVLAFTQYCKLKGYRSPESDTYGTARLCQVIGNFFGGNLSVGLMNVQADMTERTARELGLDNGVYELENWNIVKHWGWNGELIEHEPFKYEDIAEDLLYIDSRMPEHDQLGAAFILADVVNYDELKIGDVVYVNNLESYEMRTVQGFGRDDKIVNGTEVKGLPFVDLYFNDDTFENNINNYIRGKARRVKPDMIPEDFKLLSDVRIWLKNCYENRRNPAILLWHELGTDNDYMYGVVLKKVDNSLFANIGRAKLVDTDDAPFDFKDIINEDTGEKLFEDIEIDWFNSDSVAKILLEIYKELKKYIEKDGVFV